ncbi:unnamed protein product [Prorocentrum cordatum]|uniref:Uncharacterized protein n=1 Tax=Prorocentrum cordatum TaxID=2364126 RepID=A0ABN9WGJ8_9DINO|nr:unnamed protein product [Polarella glacialis]
MGATNTTNMKGAEGEVRQRRAAHIASAEPTRAKPTADDHERQHGCGSSAACQIRKGHDMLTKMIRRRPFGRRRPSEPSVQLDAAFPFFETSPGVRRGARERSEEPLQPRECGQASGYAQQPAARFQDAPPSARGNSMMLAMESPTASGR